MDAIKDQKRCNLSIEGFHLDAKRRYPKVNFVAGIPYHKDKYGNSYLSLMIGGIKPERYEITTKVLDIKDRDAFWLRWWKEVDEFITPEVIEVHIREYPSTMMNVDYILPIYSGNWHENTTEQAELQRPSISQVPWFNIYGRLSFVKEGQEIIGCPVKPLRLRMGI